MNFSEDELKTIKKAIMIAKTICKREIYEFQNNKEENYESLNKYDNLLIKLDHVKL